ncbi:hypothetical protein FNV43_RR17418 [Rhamnella rubrinervis]|uniref:DUF7795 domain-containing protein n=1 Tax=Rhamnella rubrinervis TaxID=2594499 RepID=A0A8K0E352_9ROSA|nr:hypothetical protein FNV43_RR17418 [Rhamnella rubrinervis]
MGSEEGMSDLDLDEKVFKIFKDFMARVTKFEELVAVGSRLLAGFQQGLEFLRRPPIDNTSMFVKHIINANQTKRIQLYLEAGCINIDDRLQNVSKLDTCQLGLLDHLSKGRSIINQLEFLMEDVTSAMQTAKGNSSSSRDESTEMNEQAPTSDEEGNGSSHLKKHRATDFAILMGITYSMVKQDYMMQERIVSSLSPKSSSGELESYCLMWSLRPLVNDEIMHQAWKLIPPT